MMRGAAGGAARLACFLVSIGLSFGFVSVVVAIAWASGFRLPDGVEPRDYVTLGRRGADSGLFGLVSSEDYQQLLESPTGIAWASADLFRRPIEVRTAQGITRMAHSRRVSANFFDLLGVQAAAGTLETDVVAAAVVTDAFARNAYGSAADALGREVPGMFDQPAPVAGVAEVAFKGIFDEPVDVWILEPVNPLAAASDGTITYTVTSSLVPVGVLDQGTTLAAAQNMLDGFRFEVGPGTYGGRRSGTAQNSLGELKLCPMPAAMCSNAWVGWSSWSSCCWPWLSWRCSTSSLRHTTVARSRMRSDWQSARRLGTCSGRL